ncbi:hypothetical protein [Mycolicibacterium fluoranthenivorans]|uniref:Uncharacterized protein n=1 Tax=Mycolicibacterium fluoranthenivorans TaxID=258505 RepID=A0A7X5U243_9MYCO|nr:hypothetical protein [Mycolicibacterium fluoranthenivorans]MCV7359541.1 hypothetical protein [Mycolicibacterium fluoranthenivorans]NIH96932.1 hypothetical protein [Mycolicibacterium fluoranthenivorans]
MKDAIWFLLITALGIPIGGWISAYVNAQISRATSRETALLSAAQKRRDTEIAQLRDAQSSLLEAATAVQSYVWYVDKEVRLRATIDDEDWHASREFIERAVIGAQQLRALARTLPTTELSDAYIAVERLIMDVVRGSDEDDAPDAWHNDVSGPQPDTISRAVNATADAIKQLYDTYPAEIGEKPSTPQITPRARTEN